MLSSLLDRLGFQQQIQIRRGPAHVKFWLPVNDIVAFSLGTVSRLTYGRPVVRDTENTIAIFEPHSKPLRDLLISKCGFVCVPALKNGFLLGGDYCYINPRRITKIELNQGQHICLGGPVSFQIHDALWLSLWKSSGDIKKVSDQYYKTVHDNWKSKGWVYTTATRSPTRASFR
jgi:hypothetical protein